jgi:hypothetical protein
MSLGVGGKFEGKIKGLIIGIRIKKGFKFKRV